MELIDRQAAIDALTEQADEMSRWCERYQEQRKGVLTARNIIKDLPPAQQWIPCEERLPDAGEYYFVTVQYYGWDCTECRTINIAKYELDGWRSCHNVLAWMPLPAPYRPEGDEKHEG